MVILRQTVPVVAQNLNDAAISNLTAATLFDHAFQLGLERLKSRDTTLYFLELEAGSGIGHLARLMRII